MLDIPNAALLDKDRLIGGCVRLQIAVDAGRLRAEVAALPGDVWGTTAGRVGPHRDAEALFLRGYAPAEGDKPVADREALGRVPYVRTIIEELIPAQPLRCLLARLPPDTTVPVHRDIPPYFGKTLRLHVPVETNPEVYMVCGARVYHMAEGEVWVLNNSSPHAVWNAHRTAARTHLICDFMPTGALLDLLAAGEHGLAQSRAAMERQFDRQRSSRVMTGG